MSASSYFVRKRVMAVDIASGEVEDRSTSQPKPQPRHAYVLVKLHGYPIGTVDVDVDSDSTLVKLVRAEAYSALRFEITQHLTQDGIEFPSAPEGFETLGECHQSLEACPEGSPHITVAIATLNNDAACIRTVERVLQCKYPAFDVVVVDNNPAGLNPESLLVARFADDPKVRVVNEPRAGLSFARNRGCAEAQGTIVAFTDDDVIVDRCWLCAIAKAFEEDSRVACVTGAILTSEIETPAQSWLEQYGGYNKGFVLRRYDLDENRCDSRLYPYDAGRFGSGANIAMRKDRLIELGGFAIDLGAGTPAWGGEDIDILKRVVAGGHQLVYQPAALMWHNHRRSLDALRKQMFRYGVGLSATVMKWIVDDRKAAWYIVRNLDAGFQHVFGSDSRKNSHKTERYPASLTWRERFGFAAGPFLYFKSRVVTKRRANARFGE